MKKTILIAMISMLFGCSDDTSPNLDGRTVSDSTGCSWLAIKDPNNDRYVLTFLVDNSTDECPLKAVKTGTTMKPVETTSSNQTVPQARVTVTYNGVEVQPPCEEEVEEEPLPCDPPPAPKPLKKPQPKKFIIPKTKPLDTKMFDLEKPAPDINQQTDLLKPFEDR